MPSELGQGRPQDWPDEMYALASKIGRRLDQARSNGQPVVLSRTEALDVAVGLNVGGDALGREARRKYDDEAGRDGPVCVECDGPSVLPICPTCIREGVDA